MNVSYFYVSDVTMLVRENTEEKILETVYGLTYRCSARLVSVIGSRKCAAVYATI